MLRARVASADGEVGRLSRDLREAHQELQVRILGDEGDMVKPALMQ